MLELHVDICGVLFLRPREKKENKVSAARKMSPRRKAFPPHRLKFSLDLLCWWKWSWQCPLAAGSLGSSVDLTLGTLLQPVY